MKADDKDRFGVAFNAWAVALGTHSAFPHCGAWRIDTEGDDEEFVLFSGWNGLNDHLAFTKNKASHEIGKIGELLQGVEIKHFHLQKW